MLNVKIGSSRSRDPGTAIQELYEAIYQPDASLTLLYSSSVYDVNALAKAYRQVFGDTKAIGCTTSGEISSYGYTDQSLIGLSVASPDFVVVSECIPDLSQFQLETGQKTVERLVNQLESQGLTPNAGNTFGFLLIDGLSVREEYVTAALHSCLSGIHLFGGSAGDDLQFASTHLLYDGTFHTDAAVFSLIYTTYPFTLFKTSHVTETDEELVVTDADITTRLVKELNGAPAAEEYARLVGVGDSQSLSSEIFSAYPLAIKIQGDPYVRSIQKANNDNSLSFLCAIEEGMILNLVQTGDIMAGLKESFEEIEGHIGTPQLVLGCDCILRSLEIQEKSLRDEVGQLLKNYNVFAFSTYGEQYNGVHVNQTFTGVAIGG